MTRKRSKRGARSETDLQPSAAIPGPGAILKPDGTWLEPGPNGGYLLRQGSSGKAAHAAALRRGMRGSLAERLHVASQILDDDKASNRDKLQALELLARYGLGQRQDRIDPELIKALALAVQAEVEDSATLRRIESRWAAVLRDFLSGNTEGEAA